MMKTIVNLKLGTCRFFIILTLLLILSVNVTVPLYGDTITNDFLKTLSSKLGTYKQFSAEFTQSRYMSMFKKPLISTGTISFSYPDKIRFYYKTPFESIILLDGGTMKRFRIENDDFKEQPSMEIVAKIITKEIIRFLSGGLLEDAPYHIEYTASKPNQLSLIPQSAVARSVFSVIELYLSEDLTYIEQLKLVEENGDYIHIQHTSPSFKPLSDSIFHAPE